MMKIRILFLSLALLISHLTYSSGCADSHTSSTTQTAGNSDIGQSFVAACSGQLSAIGFIQGGSTSQSGMTVKIFSGAGTSGTLLASVTGVSFPLSSSLTDYKTVDFSSKGVNLTSGYTYTIEVENSSQLVYDQVNGYSSGALYYNGSLTSGNDLFFEVQTSAPVTCSMSASITAVTQPSCNGGSDGAMVVTQSGGTSPFSYVWANGAYTSSTSSVTDTVTGLSSAVYTVTITDVNACTATTLAYISQPTIVQASNTSTTNVSCNGGSGGSVYTVGSGGTSPYTYSWSNGATTNNNSGIPAGTYTVTITDNNGCTTTTNRTVTQPSALVAATVIDSNVSCNGITDGGATASGSGGTMPYTYSWSNGATTSSITGVMSGTYTVTITDNNGCTDTESETVTQPAVLVAATTIDNNVSCNGGSDGGATASGSGGTMPYTYSWSNGATTSSITGVMSGTYTVTVTDNNGCTDAESGTITESAALIATTSIDTNVSCNGGADGGATANISGGTAPYTYSWSNGQPTQSITGLTANPYYVTVIDANGCTDSSDVTITQPVELKGKIGLDNLVSCNGGSDGSATASATGGTMPYTYAWSNTVTTASITGVSAGTYTVTITDNKGCTATDNETITQPATLVAATVIDSNVSCNGGADGGATASATGGTAPYTYAWSNSATTASITGVSAGTYTVTITDNNGCTDTENGTITQSASLIAVTAIDSNVSCNGGSDGGATASASGGTMPYTYAWSNGQTTASITGLTASSFSVNIYWVTVTDNNGCSDVEQASISEPATLSASVALDSNVSCNGGSDAGATTLVTGGTMPYTYYWSNATTTSSITGVPAGTYTVTITDNNGCTTKEDGTTTEPTALSASSTSNNSLCGASTGSVDVTSLGGTPPYTYAWSNSATTEDISSVSAGTYTVTVTDNNGCTITQPTTVSSSTNINLGTIKTNVVCNGESNGAIDLTVSGGTSPYTFDWSNSTTMEDLSGISAGTYTVTVTDNIGCTNTVSTTITEPATLMAASVIDSNASCNGFSNGGATASATGGITPYTYAWSNSATTASITGVVSGTYTVTVTDNNGCTDSTARTITEPATLIAATVVDSNVSCNGFSDGGATASASGGTMPYTYLWSNASTTASITGVTAGSYTVTVTDNNGCSNSTIETITEPAAISAMVTVDSNASCYGLSNGGATASATGGTVPYTYLWNNSSTTASITGVTAGTYTVTVTDNNGCTETANGTISEPASFAAFNNSVSSGCVNTTVSFTDASGLAVNWIWSFGDGSTSNAQNPTHTYTDVGTYDVSLTVQNITGCTETITKSNLITINTPKAAFSLTPASGCALPHTVFFTDNSTLPDTWSWDFGDGNSSTAQNPIHSYTSAGKYYVTLTVVDTMFGCSSTYTDSVQVVLTSTSIQLDSNVACNGQANGGLTASASSGVAPYTYLWSNSETTASITGITAGTYTVTTTDALGCTSTASQTVTEPTILSASTAVDSDVSCNGSSDGGATASATGGTSPYTYTWSNSATTASITGVTAATYTVTITDNNGCTDTETATITEPTSLIAATVVDSNLSCNGSSDGGATASATGGTSPYTYTWSNSATTASITGVSAATYTVTITDNNGCTNTASANITEPVTLLATTNVDSTVSCNGLSDGGATASGSGGTAPYTYTWSNSATTASITGVIAGTYTVTITDNNGCSDTEITNITEPAILAASTSVDSTVSCNGFLDGGATASAMGGTTPYTYTWSNSASTASITGVGAGTYTVTITDNNGCTDTEVATITEPTILVGSTVLDSNVSCNGLSDGGATASAVGGTTPYTYAWSNSANTASITGVTAGTYTVTVTDNNGCTDTETTTITEPALLVASTVVDSNSSCHAALDGGATASATGGTSPYTYNWSNSATTASITGISNATYTVTITDNNGCTDVSSATVIVVDTVNPTVLTNDTTIYLDANGDASVTAQGIDDGSWDACGVNTYSLDSTQFDCAEVGPNTVTLYVADVNGNLDSNTAVVTVLDTIAPTVNTQNITVYLDASGMTSIDAADIDNSSFDNCMVNNLRVDSSNFDCSETGPNSVKLYVEDVNGNLDSSTAVVTVLDTIKPIINACPANIVTSTDPNNCSAVVTWTIPTANDNCNVDSLVSNYDSGETFPIGVYTVTYIAYDPSMNTDTCSFTIEVSDDEDPVISGVPADITQSNDAGSCSAVINWTAPTASDNCTLDSLVSNYDSGETFPVGTTTVEYIAYDPEMNTDTVSFEVTVNDTELPTISCIPDTTICSSTFTYATPSGNDNCGVASVVMSNGIVSGGTFPLGSTEITFVVTDIHGNIDSCSFVVTRDEQPTVADAGIDENICLDNVTLAANASTVGAGSWSSITAGVSFVDATDPTTEANGLQRGDNILIWTIENGVCDPSSDTVIITYDQDPTVANAGQDQTLCVETATTLNANDPVVGTGTWSVFAGTANFVNASDPGTDVSGLSDNNPNVNSLVWTISNGTCEDSRDTVEIKVAQDPLVDAGADQSVFEDDGAQLSVSSSIPAISYSWSPVFSLDDATIQAPYATPSINTVYIVQLTTADGCIGSDSVEVIVESSFTVPTAFTPNNDGYNDTWEIKNLEQFDSHQILIYDQWGQEIFESNNYTTPWDGKFNGDDLPVGSYYYIIRTTQNGEEKDYSGSISILR